MTSQAPKPSTALWTMVRTVRLHAETTASRSLISGFGEELRTIVAPPGGRQASRHAERLRRVRLASDRLHHAHFTPSFFRELRLHGLGNPLAAQHQTHQYGRPNEGDATQDRVNEEDQNQKQRKPGQIEKRRDRLSLQNGTHAAKVVERTVPRDILGARQFQDMPQEPRTVRMLEHIAKACEELPAKGVQDAHENQHSTEDNAEKNQCRHALAAQHPVVDLHHVQGRRQREDIDNCAEHGSRRETLFQLSKGAVIGVHVAALVWLLLETEHEIRRE